MNLEGIKEKRSNLLGWTLLFSILLHLWIAIVKVPFIAPEEPQNASLSQPIEITQVPEDALSQIPTKKSKSNAKEVIKSEKLANEELDEAAKYLSDRSQTAKEETRAKQVGKFDEAGGKEQEKPEAQAKADTPGEGKKNWKELSLKDLGLGKGESTASDQDYLKDVKEGDRTVLSTRETKFFSYYYRIKELLQQYWRPSIQRKLNRVWSSGKTIRDDELVTRVVVLLNERGELQKVTRVASSGFQEIDSAAVEAFQLAAPFPNPPHGIVESDGLIRVYWDFILKLESSPTIQFSGAGAPPR